MDPTPREQVLEFVAAAHRVAQAGLVRTSSGNLSYRLGDGTMLVSARNCWLERLTEDNVARCNIEDGAALNGHKPSMEVGIHAGIMRYRPDINVILHFQSPAATAVACLDPADVNLALIPEMPYYVGSVGWVPYLAPGSDALTRAVVEASRAFDLLLLRNHGQITLARDFDGMLQNAEFFDLACEILLRAGSRVHGLPRHEVTVLDQARRSRSKRSGG